MQAKTVTSVASQTRAPTGDGPQVFQTRKQYSVLAASTIAFTINFAVWTMFSVIGIRIKSELGLSETEFGLLVATPILTGSLIRLPLGILTDRFGGRIVFFLQMLFVAVPTYGLAFATEYWQYLTIGLFVGLAGGSFAVGIAYTSAWFPREQQGTAMGIFGAGNAGTALTNLVAPLIIVTLGWRAVPQVFSLVMLVTALLFWFFTYPEPRLEERRRAGRYPSLIDQLAPLAEMRVWRFLSRLFLRIRRIRRYRALAAAILHRRVRSRSANRCFLDNVLHGAVRAHSRARRLDFGQVRRQHHDLVGILGQHCLSVLPLLSANHTGGARR